MGGVGRLTLASTSPLRYPGSKRKLVYDIARHIPPGTQTLVEPFCGGASVSLGLLELGVVEQVVLGDADGLIAAFWREAAFNAEKLIDAMYREPVALDRWDYWRATHPLNQHEQALKALFLNRTTFSGIINSRRSGPIGGRAQVSKYKIDARFNKDTLATRLRHICDLASSGRIHDVHHADWETTLSTSHDLPRRALYLDPPYVDEADRLYAHSGMNHERLAERLREIEAPWVLSYDDHPSVRSMYADMTVLAPDHAYSMSRKQGRELLIVGADAAAHRRVA